VLSFALVRWGRRLARAAIVAALSLMPLVGFAQPAPITISVNIAYAGIPGGCIWELLPATHSYDFVDPLARPWDSLSVVFDAGYEPNQSAVTNLTVRINGQQVGASATVNNPTDIFCGGVQAYTFTAPSMLPGYHIGGHNTLTISWNGWLSYSNPGYALLTFTYPPIPPIEFNITDRRPESERRVILTNSEPGYLYPQFQQIGAQDSMVPMYVRVTDPATGNPQVGQTVYLRVTDPPDTAPYKNLPQNVLSHVNDNDGPPATIGGNGIAAAATPGVYQGVSGANGKLDFTLTLDPHTASGDNYQVEAAFSEFFPAGATWKSGTLTAWKRIFVEKLSALRNGMPLDQDAAAGDVRVHLADNHFNGNQNNGRISRGDRIIFVHAPAIDRRNALAGWYKEEHNVVDVERDPNGGFVVTLGTRNGKTITPEPLQRDFGRDPSKSNEPAYADWVARLSGSTLGSPDYFDADTRLIWGTGSPFIDAFVEYYILPDNPFGFVPLPHFGGFRQDILQTYAQKWSFTSAGTPNAPNHQLLIIADNDTSQAQDAGVTISNVPGETSSWVWRGTIEDSVKNNTAGVADAEAWATKTCAHEIAHEWQTNGAFGLNDHCKADTPTYNDPATLCLLANADAAAQAQRANGIATFHLLKIQPAVGPPYYHSEYFGIRTRLDPFVP